MKTTRLGDLEVSVIGLGCMGMSQAYGKADLAESERTLHRALDIGVTFLDTANAYGVGHNEELIGRVLGERSVLRCGPNHERNGPLEWKERHEDNTTR